MRDYAKLIDAVHKAVMMGDRAAAADLLAAHDRELVLLANANEAAAVALARQSVAAEYDAMIDAIALEFWTSVCIETSLRALLHAEVAAITGLEDPRPFREYAHRLQDMTGRI